MKPQMSDFQKHAHVENEGLQVAVGNPYTGAAGYSNPYGTAAGHGDPYAESAGLQSLETEKTPLSPGGKEPYITAPVVDTNEQLSGDITRGHPRNGKKKKNLIISAVVAAVLVIILAAVLGGVLGSRKGTTAAPSTSPASSSTAPTSPPANSPTSNRVPSTKGVFNGTGIASTYAHHQGFWAFLFYQDYTGAVKVAQHTRPQNLDIGIHGTPQTVNIEAANGTALAAARYNESGADHFHLIYVNRQNILSDVWMDSTALDDEGNYVNQSAWSPGTLSSFNFKVPTDSRAGMYIDTDSYWYGKNYNDTGARLIVGGTDGALHQFEFDWPTMTWAPDVYKFPKSYAYGGVQIRSLGDTATLFNTTLYSTGSDGSLIYWEQSSDHPENATNWPVGPSWSDPVSVPVQAAVNSSLSTSFDSHNILFPLAQGTLGNIAIDQTAATSQFGKVGSGYGSIMVMPGTDMTFDSLDGNQLTFSQSNGTNIQFLVFDVGAKLQQGRVLID